MNTFPKISIVTPSFNQGKYIEQTICSVLDQNYPNLEYIIIDGGSTDSTVSIIKKYEKHFAYWISEPDKGQTDAINKGFKRCTGEIFNWLNSDDYYTSSALRAVSETFSADTSTLVVCGKEYGFYDDAPAKKILHKGSVIHNTVEETMFTGIIDQPCTFFKRKDIEEFFPLSVSLKYVMDRQLWLSFLAKNGIRKIKQIDDVLTYFRLHPVSKSVKEGSKFEAEFALLKLALLQNLHAPEWLVNEVRQQTEGISTSFFFTLLNFSAVNENDLLSVFAYDFAVRCYVKNDLKSARLATRFIRKLGGLKKAYLPLFLKTNLLPLNLVENAKQLKKKLSWKN